MTMSGSDKKILEYRGINWTRRLLIYSVGVSSLLGAIIGVLKVKMGWSHDLTLAIGTVCIVVVGAIALREDSAESFRWLFRNRRHDRHA
jgi:ABC-type uncharacterized transport system permease subunit